MVSHALSLLVSLTGLTGAMLRPQSKNTDGQLHVLKINLCASSNSETCGSQFPCSFLPIPLEIHHQHQDFPSTLLAFQKKTEAIAQTATFTVFKATK